jgi:multidrug efflux pump subunit AcrB
VVLALLILILSPVVILRTPTDIFPDVDIPVIAVAFAYTGLNPEEMEGRITTVFERIVTTVVNDVEHIESTTINGQAIVRVFLQPGANVDRATAQITAGSQTILRFLPPGTQPPVMINYSASTVPILQLALSGRGLAEQQLNDVGLNFLRSTGHHPGGRHSFPIRGEATTGHGGPQPRFAPIKGPGGRRCGFCAEPTEPGASFRDRQNRHVRV